MPLLIPDFLPCIKTLHLFQNNTCVVLILYYFAMGHFWKFPVETVFSQKRCWDGVEKSLQIAWFPSFIV